MVKVVNASRRNQGTSVSPRQWKTLFTVTYGSNCLCIKGSGVDRVTNLLDRFLHGEIREKHCRSCGANQLDIVPRVLVASRSRRHEGQMETQILRIILVNGSVRDSSESRKEYMSIPPSSVKAGGRC